MNPFELLAKSTLLILGVGLVARAMRGSSAAVRHRLWALGFVALAALPFLIGRVPNVEVAAPPLASFAPPSVRPSTLPAEPSSMEAAPPVENPLPESRPAPETVGVTAPPLQVENVLTVVWGLGLAFSLARLGWGLARAAAIARSGDPVPHDPDFGLPARSRLRTTDRLDVPVTFGLFRPIVLLPKEAVDWSADRLRAVALHEGAHIRRGDWAWSMLASLVRAAYWFHPLVGWAAGRLRAESEHAADDAVLRTGILPADYAEALVEIAASLRTRRAPLAVLSVVERATLRSRVAAILCGAVARQPLTRRSALAALTLVATTAVAFAALRLAHGPEVVRDGRLKLENGRSVTILAITAMDGNVARSWDVRGARLAEPYVPEARARKWFDEASHDPVGDRDVRYVFFRAGTGDDVPHVGSRPGESLPDWVYDGRTFENRFAKTNPSHVEPFYEANDAVAGSIRYVRLVVPRGSPSAALHLQIGDGAFRSYAVQTYRGGRPVAATGENAGIQVSPAPVADIDRSRIVFRLPESATERAFQAVVEPGADGARFLGQAGRQEIGVRTPPEGIRRVELRWRPLRRVTFADLPMSPTPGAVHRPEPFSPPGTVVAKNGRAVFADGTVLSFDHVEDSLHRGWRGNGKPLRGESHPSAFDLRSPDAAFRAYLFEWRCVFKDRAGSLDFYDGEGRGLLSADRFTSWSEPESLVGFTGLVGRERRSIDLLVRMPVGKRKTVGMGTLGKTRGYARIASSRGIRIQFPKALVGRLEEQDVSITPLDAAGKVVRNPRGGQSYSLSENWVEFDLEPGFASRVRGLRIESRPYGWARFPNVRLVPNAG